MRAPGYTEQVTGVLSWLWALLFGPLYFLVKGAWGHAVVYFIIASTVLAIAPPLIVFLWFGYAFATYGIIQKQDFRKGWVKV